MSALKPYFDILGISPTNNRAHIKRAYRKLAFKYHPDHNKEEGAEAEFIKIHDAYEVVMGIRAARLKKKIVTARTKSEEEILAEKMERARAQYTRMNENEKAQEEAYFKKYFEGWRWRFFQVAAFYMLIFNGFVVADYYIDGGERTIPSSDFYADYWGEVIHIGQDRYPIEHYEFWEIGYPAVRGNLSYFFDDIKSISYVVGGTPNFKEGRASYRMRHNASFNDYVLNTTLAKLSIYSAYPFMNMCMLVPILLVIFKRRGFWFNILRLISVYVLFTYTAAISLSNYRILHLLQILD